MESDGRKEQKRDPYIGPVVDLIIIFYICNIKSKQKIQYA